MTQLCQISAEKPFKFLLGMYFAFSYGFGKLHRHFFSWDFRSGQQVYWSALVMRRLTLKLNLAIPHFTSHPTLDKPEWSATYCRMVQMFI